jgi:hypothetical protein
VIRFRKLDRGIGKCTSTLGFVLLKVANMAQPGYELALRIADVGSCDHIPSCIEFLRELTETRGDKRMIQGLVVSCRTRRTERRVSSPTLWRAMGGPSGTIVVSPACATAVPSGDGKCAACCFQRDLVVVPGLLALRGWIGKRSRSKEKV